MNIETIALSINRQDIPERGYIYIYENELPIRFENEDILKEYALQTLNNDTMLTKEECNFLTRLIGENPYYGAQVHTLMGTIHEKLTKRIQFWYGAEYIYISKFWTMRYTSKGKVVVTNHINAKEYLYDAVVVDMIINHKKTKEMVISEINKMTNKYEEVR